MRATYYTLSKDNAPTPEEMRQKSREYMLMKPKKSFPKIVRETLKAKNYDLDEVETRRVTIGEDLRRLFEKLAGNKPVVRNND